MSHVITRCGSSEKGTFGVWTLDEIPLCVTCEDPWRDNKFQVSCIPVGTYKVVKRTSLKYKTHWHVLDVPDRDLILIHGGNTINDTMGCILVGRSFSKLGNLPSVVQSQDALDMLRLMLPDEFTLTVR
jgi:hypothetical protein